MSDHVPRIDNQSLHRLRIGNLTVEGWSRAGVQSYWRIPELGLGFDLGGAPWEFAPTAVWLLSHGHMDHCAALPVMIARRAMLKLDPPTVYHPSEISADLQALADVWSRLDRCEMKARFVPMGTAERIALNSRLTIQAFPTVHPVPSRGYVVFENRKRLKPEYAGLGESAVRDLKLSGVTVTEDTEVPLIAYTGDTSAPGLDADPRIYDARILITELSFIREDHPRDRVLKYGHLHLDDFVERADRFRNECVILGHVTTRQHLSQVASELDRRLPPELRSRTVLWGYDRRAEPGAADEG